MSSTLAADGGNSTASDHSKQDNVTSPKIGSSQTNKEFPQCEVIGNKYVTEPVRGKETCNSFANNEPRLSSAITTTEVDVNSPPPTDENRPNSSLEKHANAIKSEPPLSPASALQSDDLEGSQRKAEVKTSSAAKCKSSKDISMLPRYSEVCEPDFMEKQETFEHLSTEKERQKQCEQKRVDVSTTMASTAPSVGVGFDKQRGDSPSSKTEHRNTQAHDCAVASTLPLARNSGRASSRKSHKRQRIDENGVMHREHWVNLHEFDPLSPEKHRTLPSKSDGQNCVTSFYNDVTPHIRHHRPHNMLRDDVKPLTVTSHSPSRRKRRVGEFSDSPTHCAHTGSVHIKIYERCSDDVTG